MKRPTFPSLFLLFCFLLPGHAQQPTSTPTPPQSPSAQKDISAADQDVIRINTNLVQIDAVVTKDGKQVTDLNAEDFEVFESGKPQRITNFSYISNIVAAPSPNVAAEPRVTAPPVPSAVRSSDNRRTVALVVDDLGMGFQSIYRIRNQLRKFINEQLSENDLVAILRTSGEIGALQQFTKDHRILMSAIDHIKWQPCSRAGSDAFVGNDRDCSAVTYLKSLRALRYIVTGMSSLPGRKSMVVFSDIMPVDIQHGGVSPESAPALMPAAGAGAAPVTVPRVNTGGTAASAGGSVSDVSTSYESQIQQVAELAIRGSVVIYTADSRGLEVTFPSAAEGFSGPGMGRGSIARQIGRLLSERSENLFANRLGAEIMARETGGFNVHNSNDFGLKEIYKDQQGYYLIGFRPSEETFDRKFHHISVRVKRSGLKVRTRKGFYGVTDDEAQAKIRKAPASISDALMSPFGVNQIMVRLNSLFTNVNNSGSILRAFIYVNASDLSFKENSDGTHDAAFDVQSVLFGDNGGVAYLRSQTATLHLNPQQYARTLREGVAYDFDVPLRGTGASQFRIAVRDLTSGNMGTAGQVVTVPDLRKDRLALSGIVVTSDSTGQTANVGAAAPNAVPALRRFRQGDELMFGYAVYKSKLGRGQGPQLTSQTRIFHDGKLMFSGEPLPIALAGQTDLQRITGGSRLRLGSQFPVGDYVLQVIVTDNLAKGKQRTATQWIDFEVIK